MQPQLRPPDELAPPAQKSRRCAVWPCDNERVGESDFCVAHTTLPAQRTCPRCIEEGRGRGAVFMASGVAVCGACGWGRNRVPKNAPSRKAAKNKQRRR